MKILKLVLLINILAIFFISCHEKGAKDNHKITDKNNIDISANDKDSIFICANKIYYLNISIMSQQEVAPGTTDKTYHLSLKLNGKDLFNYTLDKEFFVNYLPQDIPLNQFILYNLWINSFNCSSESVNLFTSITKPETNWTFFFEVILEENTINIKISEDEEDI